MAASADAAPEVDTSCFTNDSAMMIAYERALESKRSDALFQDPLAAALAGPKGEGLSEKFCAGCGYFGLDGWPEFHQTWTAVRTRFIDDRVKEYSQAGSFAQLVNLGSGMDTRPFRMEEYGGFSGGTFDVDMKVVNDSRKEIFEKILKDPTAHCPVHTVNLDFLDEATSLSAELAATGHFAADKPTVFLAEGLIMYLGEAGKLKLIRDVTAAAAAGSVFVLQFMDATATTPNALTQEEARAAFAENGWEQARFWRFGDEGLSFGRFPADRFEPSLSFSFAIAVKA